MPIALMRPLLSCVFLLASFTASANQVIIPSPPQLGAKAYLLIDADTDKVLVEHNAKMLLPPASLTKMMTSYIVSEEIHAGRLKETDLVLISDDAWRRGGTRSGSSTMFLNPRSEVPVIDLLRGVIIQSGNDASISLAQHIAGSEDAFADVMNQQAKLLGMNDSSFRNATGWPAEGHVTTAQDLAILAKALVKDHPEHYQIYSEKYFKYNGINQPNRNKLLFLPNSYVDGIKTGHTKEAGYGLVSSAERDGMRLIAVVMGTNSEKQRANDSNKLISFGFRYYKTLSLYKPSDVIASNRVWKGVKEELNLGVQQEVVATIPRGGQKSLKAETEIDSVIEAPVKKGQVLGKIRLTLNEELVVERDLVALEAIEGAGFFSRVFDSVVLMLGGAE
ncbi:MAG: D-alanyl-D-alanine carboxypeptidase [Agarilytica sp.]